MKALVKIARETIERFFETRELKIKKYDEFLEKRGVFVTIYSFPKLELRGCIGFPYPEYPLYEGVQKAAFETAFRDSRFHPLKREELEHVIFEVSVLTVPEQIQVKHPKHYPEKIENGKDGLILEHELRKGLLLPQVWKNIPDKKEFLEALCWKAGLTPDYWLDKKTKMYKFKVQVFREKEPNGEITEE